MELIYNESQLIRAQAFKIAAAIVSLAALAGEFIAARNLIYVPLPNALLKAYDLIIVFSVTVFSFTCTLPMKMRLINWSFTNAIIKIFIATSMTASVCCLFVEGAAINPAYIKTFVRALFFILIFIKEQSGKQNLRPCISLCGIAYIAITVYYGYFGLSSSAMLISIAIVTVYTQFHSLESAYVFSAISHRKYFLNNSFDELKSFSYAYVVDFLWQENSLHLLVYTSNAEYLDIEYLPFSACFFAENAYDEKRFNCFYFDAVIHRSERLNSTNSRL